MMRIPRNVLWVLLVGLMVLAFSSSTLAASLTLWTFDENLGKAYAEIVPEFERQYNAKVQVMVMSYQALHDKLLASFVAGIGAPDLVEVEIGQVGRFWRGKIGFEDLTDRLNPYRESFPQGRLGIWSWQGRNYGIPCDIHPTVLSYRRDIFADAGLPSEPDQLQEVLKYWETDYIAAAQKIKSLGKWIAPIADTSDDSFFRLMLQAGSRYFDENGEVAFDNAVTKRVLDFYVKLGKEGYAKPVDFSSPEFFADLQQDKIASIWAPDWFINGFIKLHAGDTSGKWGAVPLPAWDEGGIRTSTQGGTMLAMTAQSANKDLAWNFIEFAWLNKENPVKMYKYRALPSYFPALENPIFHEPDSFFAGQRLGSLFIDLAVEVPDYTVSAYWGEAGPAMANTVINPALHGDVDSEKALFEAAETVREAMRREQ